MKFGDYGRYVVSPCGNPISIGFTNDWRGRRMSVFIGLQSSDANRQYLTLADILELLQWYLSLPSALVTDMIGYDYPDLTELEKLLNDHRTKHSLESDSNA